MDIRECAANSCLAVSPRFILHRTDQQPAPATSILNSLPIDIDRSAPDAYQSQYIAGGNISGTGEQLSEAGSPIGNTPDRQRGGNDPLAAQEFPRRIEGDDALCWYPMRVTYNRQLRVKATMDQLGVENFLPMREHTERRNGRIRHSRRPAISNLIFVRSTMERITELKHTDPVAALMRYMTRRPVDRPDAPAEILTVPEREMDNFIKATAGPESEYTYLRPDELRGHEHGRVLICSGPFAGVEGTIKRIHGTRRVVIELAGIGGVCINFIPRSSMIEI